MKGRKPLAHRLVAADRRHLQEIVMDGQLMQRIANRARALLALDRGERVSEIVTWTGLSRTSLWRLSQRYEQRGVEAIQDVELSGRPPVFLPRSSEYRSSGWRALSQQLTDCT